MGRGGKETGIGPKFLCYVFFEVCFQDWEFLHILQLSVLISLK